jgi:4'-phosphopantetheinyl transferase
LRKINTSPLYSTNCSRKNNRGMTISGGEKLHPVIMPVPGGIQELKGAAQVGALSQFAREVLSRSVSFSGVELGPLEKGKRGRPLPSGGIHWSISHTSKYAAAVTAPYPVGIDIEKIAQFTDALKKRVASGREWALTPVIDEVLFCRYWTAKEAVLKAAGIGIGGLPGCTITEIVDNRRLRLRYESKTWTVSHLFRAEGHVAAISTDAHLVNWHIIG